MMGFDWQKVGHLKMAERYGYIPKREDIKIIGNIGTLARKFTLKRNFWNYPALLAFHSRKLHIFFISPCGLRCSTISCTLSERDR